MEKEKKGKEKRKKGKKGKEKKKNTVLNFSVVIGLNGNI